MVAVLDRSRPRKPKGFRLGVRHLVSSRPDNLRRLASWLERRGELEVMPWWDHVGLACEVAEVCCR